MSKLWISAGIEVRNGKNIQQAKEALNKLAVATRQEPGNLKFTVLQQIDNPRSFTLWECWNNDLALQQHFKTTHTKSYLEQAWTKLIYIERLRDTELINSGVQA